MRRMDFMARYLHLTNNYKDLEYQMRNLDIKYIFQSLIALLTITFFVVGGILVSRTLAPEGYPEEPSIWDRRFGDVVIETVITILFVVAFYVGYRYLNKRYINKKCIFCKGKRRGEVGYSYASGYYHLTCAEDAKRLRSQ